MSIAMKHLFHAAHAARAAVVALGLVTSASAQVIMLDTDSLRPGGTSVVNLCEVRPDICERLTPTLVPPTLPGCLPHSAAPTGQNRPANPGSSAVAYQQFPATGTLETAWYVTYDHGVNKGLFLTGAYFKPGPNRAWVQVLGRTGLSELFVPYQSGQPRFLDLQLGFDLIAANTDDAGRCGRIVGRDGKVVREIVDKGPLWKDDQDVVRGQAMLLWATLDAANYNYIIRYEFHDDGTIKARVAGTAVNLPSAPLEPHTHNALWRIDVNLDGAGGDSVNVLRHLETLGSQSWQNVAQPFNGGREGPVDFIPNEFTQVQVIDASLKNAAGQTSSYDLRPLYRGVVRHAEPYMRNDFWATVNKPLEQYFPNLLTYADNESVRNADIVLWHVTPLLHVPRSEDGEYVNGVWQGVALAMWGGFDLRPRNLFDGTPFHP